VRPVPEGRIEAVVPSGEGRRRKSFTVQQPVGVRLQCQSDDGEVRLVAAEECPDREQFWSEWRRLGGGEGMTWEDGTSFRPGG